MTNAISRLQRALLTWSFKYNCYEAVHPWTPHCSDCALDIGLTVFAEAFKLYAPLYLFSQLVQRRRYDLASFRSTCQSVVRSTSFISLNAYFALFFFCSTGYLTGKFYYYLVAYLPGFLASAGAVLVEKPARRSSLAFYVANVASEALFRIAVARGHLRPLAHGQVYLFTGAMATLLLLAKRHGFEDDPLSAAIKLVLGPEEAAARGPRQSAAVEPAESTGHASSVESWRRHPLCPHPHCSCLSYSLRAAGRALLLGAGLQLAIRLASRWGAIWRQPHLLGQLLTERGLLNMGLFLATFSGLFKATSCSLRRLRNKSDQTNCFLAGLVAGPALLLYPSPTVALYVTWKCLEALFHSAVRAGHIKHKNLFVVILYGLATSQLFYSALMDPRYIKKSYMAFLDRISNHRLHLVNRSVLDVFGTEASAGYEDFFPDLHPKFMSRAFLGSIWIWMLEQKLVATQVCDHRALPSQ